MLTRAKKPLARVNVVDGFYMAGFEVITYGRIWVFTEVLTFPK